MSLQAHALAICATGALTEVLPAWAHVAMEPHEPLELAETRERPVVAVYIGDESFGVTGRRWGMASTMVELVVQVILPPVVRAEVGGAVVQFDTASGGTRPLYALIHEGLRRAFTAPEPGGWGELLQRLYTMHPEPITGMPGRAERPGGAKVALPVIDYSIPCQVIAPPQLGHPVPQVWTDIVARMRGDPAFLSAEADFLQALLDGTPLSAVRAELALAGLSREDGDALGIGAMPGLDTTPPPTRLTIETDRGDLVVEPEAGP